MEDMTNKILANLVFGIQDAVKQLQTLEQLAAETAIRIQNQFIKANILTGETSNIKTLTAQEAKAQAILEQSEAKKASIIAKSEAEISAIRAKEALIRQNTMQREAQTELAILKKQVEQERLLYMQARRAAFEEKPTGFLDLTLRHLSWFATGAAIFEGLNLLKNSVVDVSASMVKLKQVLEIVPPYDKSPEKLAKDLEELNKVAGMMATTYGIQLSKVLDVMAQAGRRFKDVASIISATDTAIQLMVVDSVPLETAIGSVEAIMSQFGLTTGQAKQALYEITAAAHMLQINATDLLEAIKRSGAAFKTMKADTAEAVAAISVLAQMTAQKGGMIGNAWKSLEASFASAKGQKALKELGVQLFDANGQIRDTSELLLDLQEKWRTLTDRAKMHYATVLAGGKFHYQRLEAFLSDYTGAYQKALKGIENANKEMQERLVASAMESIPRQLEITRASLEVWVNELTNELTPAFIGFLMTLRQGIGFIREHDNELGTLLKTGMKLAEAYVAWKIGLTAYNAAVKVATSETVMFNAAAARLYFQTLGLPASLAKVSGSMYGTGAAAAALAKRFFLVVAAISVLNRIIGYATDPVGQKVTDLEEKLKNLDLLISNKWRPGAHLALAAESLMSGNVEVTAQQLAHTLFGWVPNTQAQIEYYKKQRDKTAKELAKARKAKAKQDEEQLKKELDEYNKLIEKYEKEANEKLKNILKEAGLGDLTDFTGEGKAGSKSISKTIDDFIDITLSAAKAQEYLNNEIQRNLDALTAQRDFYLEGARTQDEYIKGLQEQPKLLDLIEQKQAGLHKEANLYREAIAILEAKQKTINTKTEEGREAYQKLTEEIENAKQKIAELGSEWSKLELTQRTAPAEQYREVVQWIDKLVEMGAINTEQEYKLYKAIDQTNLLYSQRMELQQKLVALGKKLIEDAVNKQIEQIEAETKAHKEASEARIASIQAQIDAMEELNAQQEQQNKLLQAQKEITDAINEQNEAQQALAEAQTKLSNVQNERNTRIFQNGVWTYIANPEAVREAQKEVEEAKKRVEEANQKVIEAQQAYNQQMLEIQQEQYKRELEAQIAAEKKKQEEFEKSQDERIAKLKDFLNVQIPKILNENAIALDKQIQEIMTALNATMGVKLNEVLNTVRTYTSQMRSEFASIAEAASMAGINVKGILPGYASGGPIPADMAIQVHAGEYVLNKEDVQALGGFAGIERLRKAITLSDSFRNSIVRNIAILSSGNRGATYHNVNSDHRIIIKNANFPHVVDASGLIRNLRQLATG